MAETARPNRVNPLAGCTRVLIDGSNQRSPSSEPLPNDVYSNSLRRLFPPSIEILVVFDTDPPVGLPTVRRTGGLTVVHARAGGADDAIVKLVSGAPDGTIVVTDDAELRSRVTMLGGRAKRNDWLRQRLELGRGVAPSLGRASAHRLTEAGHDQGEGEGDDRAPWRPGRGATLKRGPSRRQPRKRQDDA